ncbi:hypothetical protein TNCV_1441401 [Trichonephila clavipes]|uniref:Uncharacterized protein n=1 Tax=Trichonephila clavipes TaxID=2585209 RepID=A0A8X6UXF3_TRICX|nr:hypothetical protein TNCV_1441401 [Trichonephila clavipes]
MYYPTQQSPTLLITRQVGNPDFLREKGRIVQVFSGKTQTVQDMFGRGLLNLALGAELKSLPALKEGKTFRVSTSQSGNGRFRCSVAVEIQKRARFPGHVLS